MHDCRVLMTLGTIGVGVGVIGTAWVIAVVSVIRGFSLGHSPSVQPLPLSRGGGSSGPALSRGSRSLSMTSSMRASSGRLSVGSSPVSEAHQRNCSCCSSEANHLVRCGIVESLCPEPEGTEWSVACLMGGFQVVVLTVVLVGIIVE